MELVKVTEGQNGQAVSARELHEFLEVDSVFRHWIRRMFEYGFEVDVDYLLAKNDRQDSHGGHNKIDYALTLDAAKEISMLQRSEKGKQARKYFIKCEKELQNPYKLPQTYSEALAELAKTTEEQERLSQEVESKSKEVETKNKELSKQAPKVEVYDAMHDAVNSIKIGEFAKFLCSRSINIGQNRLFQWLRENKYFITEKKGPQKNIPYQKYINEGLFNVVPHTVSMPPYGLVTTSTTYLTASGQTYLTKKLLLDGRFNLHADKGLEIEFTEEEEKEISRLENNHRLD